MFITLTQVNKDNSTKLVYINTDHIIAFEDNKITLSQLTSSVVMHELIVVNKCIDVKESAIDILSML
jgi:hypothetical protein